MPRLPHADLDHVLEHTAPLWEQFGGGRLFITGGTGFVGKWLVETLLAANDRFDLDVRATVLTRDARQFANTAGFIAGHAQIELVQGDIRSFEDPAGEFSHLIHAATDMSSGIEPIAAYDVIVEGTRRVLQFAARRAIPDMLLVSSGAVYGRQPVDLARMAEDFTGSPSTVDPQAAYGNGKRAAEWLATASSAQHGLRCCIARLFAFTGPYLPLDGPYAAGNFVRDALRGSAIGVKGDGTAVRSYLYAADMTICLWTILASGRSGTAYNVGSEDEVTIAQLASAVIACTGRSGEISYGATAIPGKLPDRYVPSTRRMAEELKVDQRISFEDGLRRTIAWATEAYE